MASTYSPKLKFELIGAGEQAGLWGTTTNKNIGELIEQALAGVTTVDLTSISGNYTLTSLDGTVDQARSAVISCIGTAAGAITIIIPTSTKLYVFRNACGRTITIKTAAQIGGVILNSGEANSVFCDGASAYPGLVTAGSGTTPVGQGGTGVTGFTGGFVVSPSPFGSTALTSISAVNLSSMVTGQLGIANGGTGISTTPSTGSLLIGTSSGGYAVGNITGSSGITVTNSSGGINISTSSSSSTAIYQGTNISLSGGPTGNVTVSTVTNPVFSSSVTSPYHYVGSSAGSMYMYDNGGQLQFIVGGSPSAKITSSGIGCGALVALGDIQGNAVLNASASSGILPDGSIRIGNSSTTIFYLSNALVMAVNGTFNFSFNQNGNAYKPGGGAWADASDARLKDNVVPLTGALSKLLTLNPVSFNWKYDRPNVPNVGFIAQEVQQVMPSAVNISEPNKDQEPFIDDDKVLDVAWKNDMTAYLVKAIQELNAKVEAQAVEIAALKGVK